MRHPVFRLPVSACPIDFALHPRFVALEKRQVVAIDEKTEGLPICVPPPARNAAAASANRPRPRLWIEQTDIGKREIRIYSKGLLGRLDSPLILAGAPRAPSAQNTQGPANRVDRFAPMLRESPIPSASFRLPAGRTERG